MKTISRSLRGWTTPALFMTASVAIATLVASTAADARVGVNRPGVGVGRVGSGLGVRPGVGVGRAGLGVRGARGRLGYGYGRYGYGRYRGYGAAALTGAALAYGAGGYGYGYPSGYGYGGLYGEAPAAAVAAPVAAAAAAPVAAAAAIAAPAVAAPVAGSGYALVQFEGGRCEVWSNGLPSGSGWTPLAEGLPNWDAGEAAYHYARSQGVCHG